MFECFRLDFLSDATNLQESSVQEQTQFHCQQLVLNKAGTSQRLTARSLFYTSSTMLHQPRPTQQIAVGFSNLVIKIILSFDFLFRCSPGLFCVVFFFFYRRWLSDAVSPISRSKLVDFCQRPRVVSHAAETM